MADFPHGFRSITGHSVHEVLVGLGLETNGHAANGLCASAVLTDAVLKLDDSIIFEAGELGGQLSAGKAQRLDLGLLGTNADVQAVIAYLQKAPGTATLAEVQAGTQAFMRIVKKLLT